MSDKKKKKKKSASQGAKAPKKAAKKVTRSTSSAKPAAKKPAAKLAPKTDAAATPKVSKVSVQRQPVAKSLPEFAEPTASRNVAFPMVLVFILGVLVCVADVYLIDHSGAFDATVYYPHNEKPTSNNGPNGEVLYKNNCAACHQPNGAGARPLNFPPLAGSDWVNVDGPQRLIRIVLHGISGPITVNGEDYNNVMLPWKDTMTDEEIAAVLNYVGTSWGNSGPEVTEEQVAAVRADTSDRSRNWTAAELLKIGLE